MEMKREDRLFGELVGLRIALKRLNAQFAFQTGHYDEYMASEHKSALEDLEHFSITDNDAKRAEEIRMYAERLIDEIYTSMLFGHRPSS